MSVNAPRSSVNVIPTWPGAQRVGLVPISRTRPGIICPFQSALPIEGAEGLEPSGLVLAGERLLTVSDKHDDVVFSLELGGGTATADGTLARVGSGAVGGFCGSAPG